jgi:DNA-binding LacI/PurR family transcriptional regulator
MVSRSDVAKRAGVSTATVSRVLANKPHVSQSLKDRVLKAASELGYRPDNTARRLRSQSTSQVIGLIVSDIQNPHFAALVRGLEDYVFQHEMNIMLCNTDEKLDREAFYIERMQSERAAGVLINPISPNSTPMLEALRRSGTAIVLLDNEIEGFPCDSIGVDDRAGAYAATSHLIQLGYRRIATIGGLHHQLTARKRQQGYKEALRDAGLPIDDWFILLTDYTEEAGYAATIRIFRENPPEAIFSSNNSTTLGVIRAAAELGLRIPDDVALVSFDDLPYAEFLQSPLTAIAQPSYQIGVEAGRLLEFRIHNPTAPYRNVELPSPLIVRTSCGSKLRIG